MAHMCKKPIDEGGRLDVGLLDFFVTRAHYDFCSKSISKNIKKHKNFALFTDEKHRSY